MQEGLGAVNRALESQEAPELVREALRRKQRFGQGFRKKPNYCSGVSVCRRDG